jgi:superfamily II DNA or RNA helicase
MSAGADSFASMERVVPLDIDPVSLEDAVGPACLGRARDVLRRRAVARLWWDPAQAILRGAVHGQAGELYTTTVYFLPDDGPRPMEFEQSLCSCPVAVDCKHAAALVLLAIQAQTAAEQAAAAERTATADPTAAAAAPSPATWARSLESLLEAGSAAPGRRPDSVSLAIELTLSGTPPRLLARLVRPGKSGGWVAGTLSWAKLDSLRNYGEYPMAQVRLLQELYAMYRSGTGQPAYYFGYGAEKSIDLSEFESRQLWPMLDEAAAVGLRLVYGGKLGPVEPHGSAELCLDVTRSDPSGALVITPTVRVDGTDAVAAPIGFIGTEGHGLVYGDAGAVRAAGHYGRFRLARLSRAVPPQLQRMAVAGQRLEIPADEFVTFCQEYYPRLQRMAAVISSDGSFTAPEISGPTLVLRASYGPGHDLEVDWAWAYQVGDAPQRAAPETGPAGASYRDPDAEQALLAGLDLPLDTFGLLRRSRGPAAQDHILTRHARFADLDTMRFSTELLPLLADHPDVAVEVSGEPADYREASDSLRIGVSTEAIAGDGDWFGLGVTITVEGRQVPFADVFVALSRGESDLLLDDGAYFSLRKPELQALAALIEEARELTDSPPDSVRLSPFQASLWEELTELGVVSHQASAWQRQVDGLLSAGSVGATEPPATLTARLRPYQLDGFQWLAFLWRHQLGGILADDMGLGKTLQTLALICHARQAKPGGPPFLIVAPTSVVSNWAAEAAQFTPGLRLVTVTGTQARRGQSLEETVAGADAVVTSYALLRLDFEAYARLGWSGMILDEAQFAKNHQSKIYQCARRLPAPFKVAITGTPMENSLMELWSLLSITAPGLFPSPIRFRDYYARPIEARGDAELLAQLRRRIRPLVRRRTKEQVAADLPAKQEQVVEVELHPRHRKVYQTYLQRERQKVLGLIGDMNANRFTILRSLTLLRQLSLHAGLVDDEHAELPCSKLDALAEQLRDVTGGGHRALVFSQFTGFLGKIRERLDAEGMPYCYLDGRTRDRAAVVQGFKDGAAPVFLISLKAGGTGLNLTEADYCFLLDPWWNPATEAQAVDRTHRIGQTRNVMVYRLIAKDTIEEKVMALKARKAELFSSVIDSGSVFGAAIDADDIRGLFA